MMTVEEVRKWLESLNDTDHLAIDDDAMRIVALDHFGKELDMWIEIGGTPTED